MWQEGSHPQVIETEEVMWQKIEYIHDHPIRRGYVDDARPLALFERWVLRGASLLDRCVYRLAVNVMERGSRRSLQCSALPGRSWDRHA